MAVYTVTISAPAINEEVVVNADSEDQAKERAVYSALQRQADAAQVTVVEQSP
jgi:hypothetical protein